MPELLQMSIEEILDTEVITAGKTLQRVAEIPASIVILTREEIESHGFNTLEEILQSIPGLYGIDDYGEGGYIFGVRGFWSGVANDNVIVLVNSVPQTKNVFSNHPIPEIPVPVAAIDRIEVVRGPMSVVYGSGAFFGAINIITNDAMGGASGNHVSGAIGTAGTRRLFARTARTGADFSFAANASYERSDGVDVAGRDLMSDPSVLPSFGVSEDWRTGGALGSDRYYFDFSGSLRGLSFDLVVVESHKATQFQFPSFSRGQIIEYSDIDFSVSYRSALTEKLTLRAKADFQSDRSSLRYDFLFEDFYGFQELGSRALETTVDLFYRPTEGLTVTSGAYYRNILDVFNNYDLPDFGVPSLENTYSFLHDGDDIVTGAFYGQLQATPFRGFQVVAGARLERSSGYRIGRWAGIGTEASQRIFGTYNREKVELVPRLAAIYRLNETHVLKALLGRAINHPSFFQNSLHVVYPGRPDLDPEDITTFEINYLGTLNSTFGVNVSYFHNVLDHLITRIIVLDDEGVYDDSWFANAGRMVTDGMEISLAAEPASGTHMEISGTYQNTEDRRPGFRAIEVAYSPKFLGQFKARTRLRRNLTAALSGRYVSGMETLWDDSPRDPESTALDPVGRIGDRVGGYLTLDGNLRVEDLIRDGLWLNLRVTNLLDAVIRYPTFTNNLWADRGTLDHGRRLTMGVGASF